MTEIELQIAVSFLSGLFVGGSVLWVSATYDLLELFLEKVKKHGSSSN